MGAALLAKMTSGLNRTTSLAYASYVRRRILRSGSLLQRNVDLDIAAIGPAQSFQCLLELGESTRFFHTRTVARARARISKEGITIGAMVFAIQQAMRRVTWRVEPANDSAEAQKEAEFADSLPPR